MSILRNGDFLLLSYAMAAIFCGLLLRFVAQQADQDRTIIKADSKGIRLARWMVRIGGAGFAFFSIIYFAWYPSELSIMTVGLLVVADAILFIDSRALSDRGKPRGKRSQVHDAEITRQLRPAATLRRDDTRAGKA